MPNFYIKNQKKPDIFLFLFIIIASNTLLMKKHREIPYAVIIKILFANRCLNLCSVHMLQDWVGTTAIPLFEKN